MHDGAWLIDLRQAQTVGEGHPTGAVNLPFDSKVGYWAGWLLPGHARIVLLASSGSHVAGALPQLLRVGLDHVEGFVAGGFEAWRAAGLPVSRIRQMNARDLREHLARHDPLTVLDVRTAREWNAGHIDHAIHVPLGDLPDRVASLPDDAPIATLCEGGYRSSVAASLVARTGRCEVINITDGMSAYRESPELC
jgi:hydroxyacylglutathione hydrolase